MVTPDKFREECGVVAIHSNAEAEKLAYLGLHALQHRGQESAGTSNQLAGQQKEAEQPGHEHEGLDVVHTFPLMGSKKERDPVRSAFAWTKVSL